MTASPSVQACSKIEVLSLTTPSTRLHLNDGFAGPLPTELHEVKDDEDDKDTLTIRAKDRQRLVLEGLSFFVMTVGHNT